MLKIDYFSREFSTGKIQEQNPLNNLTLTDNNFLVLKEINERKVKLIPWA
jgi:hypothetical protein